MEHNRTKRTVLLKATASESEAAAIRETAKAAGLSTAAYLRTTGLRQKVKAAPAKISPRTTLDLSRWSQNLNQIAHGVNCGNPLDTQAVQSLTTEARRLVQAIAAASTGNTN